MLSPKDMVVIFLFVVYMLIGMDRMVSMFFTLILDKKSVLLKHLVEAILFLPAMIITSVYLLLGGLPVIISKSIEKLEGIEFINEFLNKEIIKRRN